MKLQFSPNMTDAERAEVRANRLAFWNANMAAEPTDLESEIAAGEIAMNR